MIECYRRKVKDMASRMDRYQDHQVKKPVREVVRRTNRNQNLYQDPDRGHMQYTNLSEVNEQNAVELGTLQKNYQTRENYQKLKEYQDVLEVPKAKKELEEFSQFYPNENKIYDINSVLVEAKKNREQVDSLEQKRKLRNNEYNILENLNMKELENYRKEKQKRLQDQLVDEEELSNLIDTITSKNLSKDLMSDLLPTKLDETVITSPLNQDVIAKAKEEMVETSNNKTQEMDQSFYTRSMDLSDKDFGEEVEFEEDFKPSKLQSIFKVFLSLLLITVVGFVIYFIINNI